MTDTAINTPERQHRIATAWGRHKTWTFEQVAAQVDADLAEEAEAQALRDEKTAALAASFASMLACKICGANSLGSGSGFCADCGRVVVTIRNERACAEQLNGHTRRQLVETYTDRLT